MIRGFLVGLVLASCGSSPGGSLTVNFPANLVTNGILHAAVYESGRCATLSTPVILSDAQVRQADPSDFDAQNEHPMTLNAIPAGDDRMVVAVVELDGVQVCRACSDGVVIEDGGTSTVRLILEGCP